MPNDVRGLWFGLVDLVRDEHVTRTLYVAGTAEFDANDGTGDWATANRENAPSNESGGAIR